MSTWGRWADAEAATIRAAGQWRTPRELDAAGPEGTLADGSPVVSFASNDYLGLTQHPAVVGAAQDALARWGAGSGAARLIVGSRPVHHQLEQELAAWKGDEAAVVFPTGFAANLGVLTTVGGPGVRILSDELNHASIIDGCRLARADVAVYRHRDVDHVRDLLAAAGDARCVVVTDVVFSMDGDVAPVRELADVCAAAGALLVLDEAHSVLGPFSAGLGDADGDVLRVGTLSKTLGALGGFVSGARRFVDLVVNRARSYIFTTAPTPADTAAALAAVRVLRSSEGHALVRRLRSTVDAVVPGHPSPIIPVVVGDEDAAVVLAAHLLERGLLVPAIRPPTVPPGTCRLRIALSAAHTDAHLERLLAGLDDCLPGWRSCIPAEPATAARP
jgi:8-amino-7-oxononanoate synthase